MPAKEIQNIALPSPAPGTQRTLRVTRHGDPESQKKAYLQAGLHADEPPGQLIMHHLQELLDQAAEESRVTSLITLVPTANPIGLAQWERDELRGRFHTATGINFNRNHLDLIDPVAEAVKESLTQDPATNIALIRKAMAREIQAAQVDDEAAFLKKTLLSLSFDAEVVLDLHCDFESLVHVYTGTPLWPEASDLSAQVGARATLLAKESGSDPFDEACSKIWWALAEKFPDHPIPPACLAATIEFRGMNDISHDLARADAQNLYHFLIRRGFIDGQAPELPPLPAEATPLRGLDAVKATAPGGVAYPKTRVRATSQGLLLSRRADRQVRPGSVLANIAGDKPLEGKGKELLSP
jgi:uncharacterized protein